MQIATTKCSLEMMSQSIFDTFTFHANPKFWFSCATNFAHFKIICSTINVKEQQPNYKIKSFNSSQQLLLQFEVDVGDISIFHKHLFFLQNIVCQISYFCTIWSLHSDSPQKLDVCENWVKSSNLLVLPIFSEIVYYLNGPFDSKDPSDPNGSSMKVNLFLRDLKVANFKRNWNFRGHKCMWCHVEKAGLIWRN